MLINSTFTSDSATGSVAGTGATGGQGKGGAIFVYTGATATIDNTTFSGDSASNAGTSSQDNANYFGSLTVDPTITVNPGTLPAGNVNTAYNQAITASGGSGAINLVVSNVQNAIAGLSLPASGNPLNITGTPTVQGRETFIVTATDSLGGTTSTTYSITSTGLATFTWTGAGADANWSTAANWQGGVAPTPTNALGGTLVFGPGEAQTANANDILGLSVAEMNFAGGYTIGGETVTLTGLGGTGIDSQTGTTTIYTPITLANNVTFTTEVPSTLGLASVISGSGRLTYNGAGQVIVLAANTYTGGTTIAVADLIVGETSDPDANLGAVPATPTPDSLIFNGGFLNVGLALSLNANRGITVDPTGGKMEVSNFTGTINGLISGTGELTIFANSRLTLGGGESVDLTGTTAGAGYLQLNWAVGNVRLGTTAVLNVALGYTPTLGDSYMLINNASGSPVIGTFAGLPEGARIVVGGATFQITYKGGDGNDVVLTCVPITTSTMTTVASSLDPSVYGQAVTFTATVNPVSSSSFSPTGTVTFVDGSTTLGTATVITTAGVTTATLSTNLLAAGAHGQIIAEYLGDSNFVASNSASFVQIVNQASLTIAANNASTVYASDLPTLGVSYAGFVNGENPTVLGVR